MAADAVARSACGVLDARLVRMERVCADFWRAWTAEVANHVTKMLTSNVTPRFKACVAGGRRRAHNIVDTRAAGAKTIMTTTGFEPVPFRNGT